MFRYHVVGCRQLRSQDLLEEGYATTLSGHPLRFSEKEVSPGPAPYKASAAFKPLPLRTYTLSPSVFKPLSLPLGQGGLRRDRAESHPRPCPLPWACSRAQDF